jgi:hypothetical protein
MNQEAQCFGEYLEAGLGTREFMVFNFSSMTLDINQLWENSALSAKFLSSFWGTFFPLSAMEPRDNRKYMEDAVRFIAAELLGNAVKFGYGKKFDIRINLHMEHNELRIYVTNDVDPALLPEFQAFINRLLTEDPSELYVAQMEKNARSDSQESRMGYLTIILDYEARLSWKFERRNGADLVTTAARLPVIRQLKQEGA